MAALPLVRPMAWKTNHDRVMRLAVCKASFDSCRHLTNPGGHLQLGAAVEHILLDATSVLVQLTWGNHRGGPVNFRRGCHAATYDLLEK